MKKAVAGRKRKWLLVRFALVAATAASLLVFLVQKKERMLKECTRFFETSLSHQTDLVVRVDRIGGNLLGVVRVQGLRVSEPPDAGGRTLFTAREVRVNYRFLDFLSKSPRGGVQVYVDHPEVYWAPHVTLRRPDFPFLAWMRETFSSRRGRFVLRAKDMDFFYGESKRKISGIQLTYEGHKLKAEVPLSHLQLGHIDFSSTVIVQGRFVPTSDPGHDEIRGSVRTEATVINWKPASLESSADFIFSRKGFHVTASDILGVEVLGSLGFADYDVDFSAKAADYPLSTLSDLLALERGFSLPGRADAELRVKGDVWSPAIEGWIRVRDGMIGRRAFRALDLHAQGIYPTVSVSDSRILLQDGTAMRFADTTLEFTDLLKEKTLSSLIGEAQQDTVVWGDWELSRAESRDERSSDLLMQRSLGENARVHFRRYNDVDEYPNRRESDREETKQMEVGFEYRLRPKDSVKLELRDGEEFVGVERKMKF